MDLEPYRYFPVLHHSQFMCGSMGEVNHPVVSNGATVVDPLHNPAAIVQIGDAQLGAEGAGAMAVVRP